MEIRNYIRHSLPDFLLCLLITAGLAIHVYQGFYLPQALSTDVLRTLLVAAAADALLFLAAYSRRSALTGVLVGVLAIGAAIVLLQMTGLLTLEGENAEANGGWWYFLTVFCALLVFLLTRTPAGTALLFGGGAVVLAMLDLLQYDCYPLGLLAFLWGCGVMYLYKCYRRNVLRSSTIKNAFSSVLCCSMVLATLGMVLSGALWWGVVRPLDPPTREIKLINKIMSLEVLEVLGISQTVEVMDFDAQSNVEDEDISRLTSQTGDSQELPEQVETRREEGDTADGEAPESAALERDESEAATEVTYTRDDVLRAAISGAVVLALLLAAAIWLWRRRRKNWFRRLGRLGAEGRVIYLYGWFLKKFPLLGLPQSGADTPYDYAARVERQTRFLTVAPDADWHAVTELFVQTYFGGQPVPADGERMLERFCGAFHKNCRHALGGKYLWKWFRL